MVMVREWIEERGFMREKKREEKLRREGTGESAGREGERNSSWNDRMHRSRPRTSNDGLRFPRSRSWWGTTAFGGEGRWPNWRWYAAFRGPESPAMKLLLWCYLYWNSQIAWCSSSSDWEPWIEMWDLKIVIYRVNL